ncbi:MAG: EamA family transporter [Paramuribaculum sp.]|nr:EamA family transporter [Paramuribaculum sp.]
MSNKIKGYFLAALAAAAYGTNPAFAVPLYETGMNPNSVLLFRYALGIPLLLIVLFVRKIPLSLKRDEIFPVAMLGVLMALSSLTLFESYRYMNSGIASTLLFVYPIMVAVIMIFFFHEKFKINLLICLLFMCSGLFLLMKSDATTSLSGYGCLLVMISALTYALYIVLVNVSKVVSAIPTTKLLFYVLIFGCFVFLFAIAAGSELTVPQKAGGWLNLFALALIPTVVSLACTSAAIHLIGSTSTAIFGALEPVTAVILSMAVLRQSITWQEILGGLLIVVATTIVVGDKSVDKIILRVRKMFPRSLLHNNRQR